MREIKFRTYNTNAYYIGKSRMNYAPILESDNIEGTCINSGIEHDQKHEMVWMQYTGLKDKNGKEIYEGDIIEARSGHNTEPVFNGVVKLSKGEFFIEGKAIDILYSPHRNFSYFINEKEVIGNVYESPELVK